VSGKTTGYAAILTAAFLFGMWATVGTFALQGVPPITVAWLIQAVSALAFSPFLRRLRLTRRDVKYAVTASALGAVLAPSLYFTGLSLSSPVNAALLSNTEAMFTAIFAFVFLKERLSRAGYLSAVAILAGAVLVTLNLGPNGTAAPESMVLGSVLLISAAVSWGASNTASRVVTSHHDIAPYVCVTFGMGTIFLAPIVLLTGNPLFVPLEHFPLVLFLGLTGSVGFTYLFYFAMRKIGALQVGAILSTSAAFGVAIAVAFGFSLSPLQALGGAIMAIGVVVMYLLPPAKGIERVAEIAGAAPADGPPPKG